MTEARKQRFGIVGTGRMATTMASALARRPDCELTAVCSSSRDRAQQFATQFGFAGAYADIETFCAAPDIDVVYVANASRAHAATSVAALSAGKAVLCEKPFALTPAEGEQVAEAARRAKALFMEGYWTLLLPSYARLRQIVEQKTLGTPLYLRFEFGYPVHETDRARLMSPDDGGVLFDRGGYGVGLVLHLLGPAKRVVSAVTDGTHVLQISHESGAMSHIAVSADILLSNTVSLGCTDGTVNLDPPSLGSELVWSRAMTPGPKAPASGKPTRQGLRSLPLLRRLNGLLKAPKRIWAPYGADQYDPMLSHFIDGLAAGRTTSPLIPPSLSLDTLKLLSLASVPGVYDL